VIDYLDGAVEHEFFKKLKAEEVEVASNKPSFELLVLKLAHLQLFQRMSSLKVDQPGIKVPFEHLSPYHRTTNYQHKCLHKVLKSLNTSRSKSISYELKHSVYYVKKQKNARQIKRFEI
jgi:hypothetical protein